jgi:putative nucleotidyltransferase with HDIG domain
MSPAGPQSASLAASSVAAASLAAARAILQKLRDEGHQAYLAGGCVRDLLLGREPKDYDVATSATPDIVLDLFPRTFAVGAHFGVVLVSAEFDSIQTLTEVATFRSDGVYSDGRHPNAVRYTTSPEEDVQRRDFTINGLLLAPDRLVPMKDTGFSPYRNIAEATGALAPEGSASSFATIEINSLKTEVLDYVGGLADLESGLIRAIGSPHRRFEEDHLRMLRAVRFAARFQFEIDPATHSAIQSLAPKIEAVSRERVRDELTRMLTEGHARLAFERLDATGLLAQILPEVSRMKGVNQPPQFHPEGDVWTHTLLLLTQLEAGCPMTLAWGALLHDIGKPATYQPPSGSGDRIRFNGHVEVGVRIGAEICRRLHFSNDETTQILALIENHMRFADTPRMKPSTLKRFFRLDRFPEHLALHRMDCLASSLNMNGNLDNYHFARERYEAIPPDEVCPKPLLTGRELIAAGYSPGPAFKTMLHAVEEAQLEGSIHTPEEALHLIHTQFPLPEDSQLHA